VYSMRIAMSNQLFTTGYEGLDLQAFVRCLEDNGIQCVLDVRENPFSRKPGFSKGPLSQALEARGIHYVHLKELGTPRSLRDAVKSDGDYGKFFHEMQRYLATQPEAIDRACDYISRMTCCLVCYEKSVDTCHRKIVAESIQKRHHKGLTVAHLQV
jgi:uncharacterized protein (DUF488 family)